MANQVAMADELMNPDDSYRRFWHDVGSEFPSLDGALSTAYYRQNELRLFRDHLPPLPGLRVFKTDLWDEAKSTRLLQWVLEQGAVPFGVDISPPTAAQARDFVGPNLLATVGDCRQLPYREASFDAIYSMGTIEHFLDPESAVREMYRVLRPGGTAIVGVPNRFDPFLRPLFVAILYRLGLYAYGYEKSFSRAQLRGMLERSGFEVVSESAILFMPGWLRMLDLAASCWARPLAKLTALAVRPFMWLDAKLPAVRRHGYLLATIVRKPVAT